MAAIESRFTMFYRIINCGKIKTNEERGIKTKLRVKRFYVRNC